MTQPDQRMAQAFDDLAGSYDDAYHDEVARALVAFAAPTGAASVADADLDLVLCASSLHFLGRPALADWLRALRPGGRVGFTLPLAADFRPRGVFADLLATDLVLPGTAEAAAALARSAGFTGAAARTVAVGARTVALVRAQAPAQAPAPDPDPTPAARAATRS